MKVSIIIPLYNAEKYISECIESALNQTYKDIEIIIVDDGSTDNSFAIASQYKSEKVKLFSQDNKGAAAARNVGLSHATGNYIQFLDADDTIDTNKIGTQMNILQELGYPDNIVVSGKWCGLGKDIEQLGNNHKSVWHSYQKPTDILVDFILAPCCFPPIVYLTPKKLIQEVGSWDESLSKNDDGEFFARIMRGCQTLLFCPNAISYYRSTPNSLSKQMSRKASISQIQSQLSTAHIIAESKHPLAEKAICQMITSSLHSIYPYYKEARKPGEHYLKSHYPDYRLTYHSLNWKEWIYYFLHPEKH